MSIEGKKEKKHKRIMDEHKSTFVSFPFVKLFCVCWTVYDSRTAVYGKFIDGFLYHPDKEELPIHLFSSTEHIWTVAMHF